jgi:hypothetical protein
MVAKEMIVDFMMNVSWNECVIAKGMVDEVVAMDDEEKRLTRRLNLSVHI